MSRVCEAVAFGEVLFRGDDPELPAADLANLLREPELECVVGVALDFVFLLLDLDDLDGGVGEEALAVREIDDHATVAHLEFHAHGLRHESTHVPVCLADPQVMALRNTLPRQRDAGL
jgi:hypothetical protein